MITSWPICRRRRFGACVWDITERLISYHPLLYETQNRKWWCCLTCGTRYDHRVLFLMKELILFSPHMSIKRSLHLLCPFCFCPHIFFFVASFSSSRFFCLASTHSSLSDCFPAPWQLSCGWLLDLLWLHCCRGYEEFLGWALVRCLQIAGVCRVCRSRRKDMTKKKKGTLLIWKYSKCICMFSPHPPPAGAAKDYRTAGLRGRGVSEKGPDPQRPPQRPAALPRWRCLGESPHPALKPASGPDSHFLSVHSLSVSWEILFIPELITYLEFQIVVKKL